MKDTVRQSDPLTHAFNPSSLCSSRDARLRFIGSSIYARLGLSLDARLRFIDMCTFRFMDICTF
ncbi:unnamed protein product, partial [Rotaria sordida]